MAGLVAVYGQANVVWKRVEKNINGPSVGFICVRFGCVVGVTAAKSNLVL